MGLRFELYKQRDERGDVSGNPRRRPRLTRGAHPGAQRCSNHPVTTVQGRVVDD